VDCCDERPRCASNTPTSSHAANPSIESTPPAGAAKCRHRIRKDRARADLFIAESYYWDKQVPYHLRHIDLLAHRDQLGSVRTILTPWAPRSGLPGRLSGRFARGTPQASVVSR
jgi:hypothetical protein